VVDEIVLLARVGLSVSRKMQWMVAAKDTSEIFLPLEYDVVGELDSLFQTLLLMLRCYLARTLNLLQGQGEVAKPAIRYSRVISGSVSVLLPLSPLLIVLGFMPQVEVGDGAVELVL